MYLDLCVGCTYMYRSLMKVYNHIDFYVSFWQRVLMHIQICVVQHVYRAICISRGIAVDSGSIDPVRIYY